MEAGRAGQSIEDVRFTQARPPDTDDVSMLGDPTTVEKLLDDARLELCSKGKVVVVEPWSCPDPVDT